MKGHREALEDGFDDVMAVLSTDHADVKSDGGAGDEGTPEALAN